MKKISRRNFFKGAALLATMPLVASEEKKKKTNSLKLVHITDAHRMSTIQRVSKPLKWQ